MLARSSRLHRSADFTAVVRGGRRASRPTLTVHLLVPAADVAAADVAAEPDPVQPARAGLVVGKGVGGSVVRSRVSRRLRHLLRDRLGGLPAGSRLVVRASPAAATAASAALGADLDAALARAAQPPRAGRACR